LYILYTSDSILSAQINSSGSLNEKDFIHPAFYKRFPMWTTDSQPLLCTSNDIRKSVTSNAYKKIESRSTDDCLSPVPSTSSNNIDIVSDHYVQIKRDENNKCSQSPTTSENEDSMVSCQTPAHSRCEETCVSPNSETSSTKHIFTAFRPWATNSTQSATSKF
jgi:hypothetical protein